MQEMSEADRLALRCQKLAPQVLFLCEHLAGRGVRTRPWSKDPQFLVIRFDEDYEPGKTLYVAARGSVVRHTCEYSYHNGDSYGHEEDACSPEECLDELRYLRDRLIKMALKDVSSRARQAEERRQASNEVFGLALELGIDLSDAPED